MKTMSIDLKKAKKVNQVSHKAKENTTDAKTAKVVKEKIAKERDVMYNYPAGLDAIGKKKFRSDARRQKASRMKAIANEKNAEKKEKLIRKANKWSKTVYAGEHAMDFE